MKNVIPKQIVIEVPDWVNPKIVEDLKKMLTEVLEDRMKSDKVDIFTSGSLQADCRDEHRTVSFGFDCRLRARGLFTCTSTRFGQWVTCLR